MITLGRISDFLGGGKRNEDIWSVCGEEINGNDFDITLLEQSLHVKIFYVVNAKFRVCFRLFHLHKIQHRTSEV